MPPSPRCPCVRVIRQGKPEDRSNSCLVSGHRRPSGGPNQGSRGPDVVSVFSLHEAGSGFNSLPFDSAVDRRPTNTEEFSDLGSAVLAAVHQ